MCDAFVSGNPGKEEKMKLYEIDNLTFAYPDIASERDDVYLKPVLKDIGLSIEKGSFVIVAGGSGSGKTTLLRQLKSVLTPRGKREGTVCFQGKTWRHR